MRPQRPGSMGGERKRGLTIRIFPSGIRDFAVKKFKCGLALQSYAEVRTPSTKTPLAHTSKKNLSARLASRAGGNLNFRRKIVSLDLLVLLGQAKRTTNIALGHCKWRLREPALRGAWHVGALGTSSRMAWLGRMAMRPNDVDAWAVSQSWG